MDCGEVVVVFGGGRKGFSAIGGGGVSAIGGEGGEEREKGVEMEERERG